MRGILQFQKIKTDRTIGVGRVKVDHIIHPFRRHKVQQFLNQIPVRIQHRHPLAVLHILHDHILKDRRLSGTGLTDQIHMLAPVNALDSEFYKPLAEGGLSEVGAIGSRQIRGRFALFVSRPSDRRSLHGNIRQVKDGGQLGSIQNVGFGGKFAPEHFLLKIGDSLGRGNLGKGV